MAVKCPEIFKRRDGFVGMVNVVSRNYFKHNVGKNSAALAYYLMFATFPLIIFFSNLLGFLNLDINSIIQTMDRIFPEEVSEVVDGYLNYTVKNSSRAMLIFAFVFSVWFPTRAVSGLMNDVRRAYGMKKSKKPVWFFLRTVIYTVVFLLSVVVTLLLSAGGREVLGYINGLLPAGIRISDYLLGIWQYLRFGIAAVLMLAAIVLLYAVSQDERKPIKQFLPGGIFALLTWLTVSVGFSFYLENFANYTLIYGTLGTVIVYLMWLFLTANVLIIGAEINAYIDGQRKSKKEKNNTGEAVE